MLRRSFLQLLAAAIVTPAITPLEPFVPSPAGPVLACELTDPYWLLEMRAYQRLYNQAWSAALDGTLALKRGGKKWTATFPTHPDVGA